MRLKLFTVALITIFLVGCNSSAEQQAPEDKPQAPSIELLSEGQAELVFPETGSDIKVMFSASAAWTAQVLTNVPGQWCTVTPESGEPGNAVSITVHTDNNDTGDDRDATVILLCGSAKVSISVTQKTKNALTVTKAIFDFGPEGGSFTIEAKHNVELSWEIDKDCKDWIHPSQTKALTTSLLEFDVDENEGDGRSGSVMLKAGSLTEKITVNQQASRPSIILGESEQEVKAESGRVTIPLKTNVPVSVEIPDEVDWVHYVETKALESKEVVLSIDENESADVRQATIYLVNEDNQIRQPFTIRQGFKAIAETEDFYSVGPEGGIIEIKLSTNLDSYSVVVPDDASDWLSYISTKAIHTDILSFSVAATDLYQTRQARVSIQDADGVTLKQFTIKQNAKAIPNNEIWYTTKYGYTIEPNVAGFNCNLRENVYSDGYGRLVFDDDILTVGANAFKGQTSLIGVTLPNSVQTIKSGAFQDCSSMTDIYLSADLATVESGAFNSCTGTIHFNGKKLPNNCCKGATGITALELGDKVESIGDYAFQGCSALNKVYFPEKELAIGDYAFSQTGITEFVWYGALYTIRSYAFSSTPLEKVTFVEEDKNYSYVIRTGVFESTKLTEIVLSDHVGQIDSYAFKNSKLTKVVIGKNVGYIANEAFYGCSLKELTINRQTPPWLGSGAFYSCWYLPVTVPEGTELAFASSEYWYPLLTSGTFKSFNGFNNFLSASVVNNYEPYTKFSVSTSLGEKFPLRIRQIGLVADLNENNLTVEKASCVKMADTSSDLIRTDNNYNYQPVLSGLKSGTQYYYRAFAIFEGGGSWYSSLNSLYRNTWNFDQAANVLSWASNCQVISPVKSILFVPYYGNTDIIVPAKHVIVLWESDGTSSQNDARSVIKAVSWIQGDATDPTPRIAVSPSGKEGNAVIAAVDKYYEVLWSWHIWVTSAKTDEMKQVYRNTPKYMMDRNLGALSATPGDPKSVGLGYQWGRKDPFPVLNQRYAGTIETVEGSAQKGTVWYSTGNPSSIIGVSSSQGDWLYSTASEPVRWSSTKGMYDPCPSGWRVPEGGNSGVWSAASRTRADYYRWSSEMSGSDLKDVFLTEGTCWYPANSGSGDSFMVWGCNSTSNSDGVFADRFSGNSSAVSFYSARTLSELGAVRCVSEENIHGNHEGTEEEDWGL